MSTSSTTYRIRSNYSASYSCLHGTAYATRADAEEAIDALHPTGDSVVYPVGDEWFYYESDEDAQDDKSNTKAIAVLEEVVTRDDRAYGIDDGEGNSITQGVSAHEIDRVAQRFADERGEPVWYYRSPAREGEESTQVDPA